jgi:hypothetical protein
MKREGERRKREGVGTEKFKRDKKEGKEENATSPKDKTDSLQSLNASRDGVLLP